MTISRPPAFMHRHEQGLRGPAHDDRAAAVRHQRRGRAGDDGRVREPCASRGGPRRCSWSAVVRAD